MPGEEVTCTGLASHPRENAKVLDTLFHRKWNKLRVDEPFGYGAHFIFLPVNKILPPEKVSRQIIVLRSKNSPNARSTFSLT